MPGKPQDQRRLALTKEQRSTLESVYDMQKLPDAELRERLSRYLDLSPRQIQVWFQNRRQRAKSGSSTSSPIKKATVNSSSQVMDALFEFSSTLASDSTSSLTNANMKAQGRTQGRSGSSVDDSASTDSLPAGSLDCETFEWGLPAHPLLPMSGQPTAAASSRGAHAPVAMRGGGDAFPFARPRGRS